jgi:capsular exopolysaccharide synthesis family protein
VENNNNGYSVEESNTLKDYINLLRNNLVPVLIITVVCFLVAVIFAFNSVDIYRATTTLKIAKPQGSILESPLMPEFQDFGSDRFIANEIEVLKSFSVRENVARALYDSVGSDEKKYSAIMKNDFEFSLKDDHGLTVPEVANMLSKYVDIEQKRGLDIVEISVESPSPKGAAILANVYASEYRNVNLSQNRNQLTMVKNFLKDQRQEKLDELRQAEDILSAYQQKGGIVALDQQANTLISTLSTFDAQKDAAKIELSASNKVLTQYKEELERQNPRLADYLQSVQSEASFKVLQEQIADLENRRDMAISDEKDSSNPKVKEYDQKLKTLRKKLDEKIAVIKSGIFASSPEEVKELSQKILVEEIKNQTLRTSLGELSGVVNKYEGQFKKLPRTAIEAANFQRNRESLQKLYLLVEEKYQEALINEQSQPGNVLILDQARVPEAPAKPNRMLIVLIGIVLGCGLAFGYVFVRNYFDNTVKTPEDIQNKNINVLTWIPQIEGLGPEGNNEFEFIVARKPDSIPAEAFRALRTRIQFSKLDNKSLKTILVTSSAPQEGKTTVSVNLAGSFAQSNKKVLIVDCDLRKPRMHTVFNASRYPGLIDYLFGQVKFEEILRESEINNLSYITSGTIPPNPSEMLDSQQMRSFIEQMREKFDIVIFDSPPIVAVTDSEILSQYVDATLLVVLSEKTEVEMLEKSVNLIKNDSSSFIGTVLNNFSYKAGYGSYYKYYYYYSNPQNNAREKRKVNKDKANA